MKPWNKTSRLNAGLVFLLALALTASFAVAQKGKPSGDSRGTGLFDDLAPNLVRSDGAGIYNDGADCVAVNIASNGFYQVRTIANTDACKEQVRGEWRFLSLDFGKEAPGDLDGDGSAQNVEQPPARFIASKAFDNKATTTPVYILVLKVNPNGTTTQDTSWELRYHHEASMAIHADGSRDIFLGQRGAAAATADLCEVVTAPKPSGKGSTTSCVARGTFNMPFWLTAAPQ